MRAAEAGRGGADREARAAAAGEHGALPPLVELETGVVRARGPEPCELRAAGPRA